MYKNDFPIFQKHPGLVYLDNAATTQKPAAVIEAITEFYTTSNANIGRSVCALGDEATRLYEQARQGVSSFLNAQTAEEIIFTRSTTEAINLVASILADEFEAGDEIILSELEHHSNLIPWQRLAQKKQLKLKFIPVLESGKLDLEAGARLFSPKSKLVAFSHLSNVMGSVTEAGEIIRLAKKHGAFTLIDGAQAVSKIRVDVQALGCDFYAFSGHKLYGPTGIGVLYGRRELLAKLPPYQTRGKTIDRVEFESSTLAPLPAKYEAGTPHIAGAIGLGAALNYLAGKWLSDEEGSQSARQHFVEGLAGESLSGQRASGGGLTIEADQGGLLFAYEKELTDYAESCLAKIEGVKLLGGKGSKLGVISWVVEGLHPLDIAAYLAGQNICLRSGHHCAQPLLRKFGLETTLRISLGVYNDYKDVDYFLEKLQKAVRILS